MPEDEHWEIDFNEQISSSGWEVFSGLEGADQARLLLAKENNRHELNKQAQQNKHSLTERKIVNKQKIAEMRERIARSAENRRLYRDVAALMLTVGAAAIWALGVGNMDAAEQVFLLAFGFIIGTGTTHIGVKAADKKLVADAEDSTSKALDLE